MPTRSLLAHRGHGVANVEELPKLKKTRQQPVASGRTWRTRQHDVATCRDGARRVDRRRLARRARRQAERRRYRTSTASARLADGRRGRRESRASSTSRCVPHQRRRRASVRARCYVLKRGRGRFAVRVSRRFIDSADGRSADAELQRDSSPRIQLHGESQCSPADKPLDGGAHCRSARASCFSRGRASATQRTRLCNDGVDHGLADAASGCSCSSSFALFGSPRHLVHRTRRGVQEAAGRNIRRAARQRRRSARRCLSRLPERTPAGPPDDMTPQLYTSLRRSAQFLKPTSTTLFALYLTFSCGSCSERPGSTAAACRGRCGQDFPPPLDEVGLQELVHRRARSRRHALQADDCRRGEGASPGGLHRVVLRDRRRTLRLVRTATDCSCARRIEPAAGRGRWAGTAADGERHGAARVCCARSSRSTGRGRLPCPRPCPAKWCRYTSKNLSSTRFHIFVKDSSHSASTRW